MLDDLFPETSKRAEELFKHQRLQLSQRPLSRSASETRSTINPGSCSGWPHSPVSPRADELPIPVSFDAFISGAGAAWPDREPSMHEKTRCPPPVRVGFGSSLRGSVRAPLNVHRTYSRFSTLSTVADSNRLPESLHQFCLGNRSARRRVSCSSTSDPWLYDRDETNRFAPQRSFSSNPGAVRGNAVPASTG